MPDSSPETQKAKVQSDKKQPETVQLTAEELKAIAGGAKAGPPPVSPTNDIVKPGGTNRSPQ